VRDLGLPEQLVAETTPLLSLLGPLNEQIDPLLTQQPPAEEDEDASGPASSSS
jgi:hypothetical protein